MINATHKASLPKLYEARAAYIYKPDGKCIGMMTPERFHLFALVRDNPNCCTTLGFITKTKLTYAMPTSWKGVQRNFSNHALSMDIIAVWNKEAKQRLTDASPNWLQTLQRSIPEAV